MGTRIEEGVELTLFSLGGLVVKSCSSQVKPLELLKEVQDIVEELNDRPTSLQACREAWAQYDLNPTMGAREKLRAAYHRVPEHCRAFLGGMDVKDVPIRMVLFGEDEIENWSHRIAARKSGNIPLPTIQVKQPRDE